SLLSRENDPANEIFYTALQRKQREIQENLTCLEATRKQIMGDILNLEQGIGMLDYLNQIKVQLVETGLKNILFLRRMMNSVDYAGGYGVYFGRLYERIAAEKLTRLGSPLTIYHSPEYDPAGNDTEFAIPIAEKVRGSRDLPGGLHAKCVLQGPYSQLTSVYARLQEWMENKGYELSDSPYEIYLNDPYQDISPENLITEVYYPVKKK
ncbi:MAG: GyrI-like domain-containing protein, partial [Anaerolineae bacterium]|nr:GyrI-like domain-containing protein [Anaerolineae bacterium]